MQLKNIFLIFRRTADVRSVGYSELFSLSREDVLAAMKDYPEAQEILQTLGRKRLQEARNSSRKAKGKCFFCFCFYILNFILFYYFRRTN